MKVSRAGTGPTTGAGTSLVRAASKSASLYIFLRSLRTQGRTRSRNAVARAKARSGCMPPDRTLRIAPRCAANHSGFCHSLYASGCLSAGASSHSGGSVCSWAVVMLNAKPPKLSFASHGTMAKRPSESRR